MSKKAFDKIAEGLREAIAVARGEKKPAKLFVPTETNWQEFDQFQQRRECPAKDRPDLFCIHGRILQQYGSDWLIWGRCECCIKATGGVKKVSSNEFNRNKIWKIDNY